MKKSQILLTLASALLLLGCSSKQTPSITDNSNYDSDVTEDITTDGDTNNYDTIETETEDVETPSEYDEFENGEIKKAITVKAAYFTPSAKEKIEAAGGKAEIV